MSTAAIYPGTFDPLTYGHLDVIERAAAVFDRLLVAVAASSSKSALFEVRERQAMIRESLGALRGVEVVSFDGLLVAFAHAQGVKVVVRGVRAFSDFEYEFQMALTNRRMAPDVETVYLMPREENSYISSSVVREIARLGGPLAEFVPDPVARRLRARFGPGAS